MLCHFACSTARADGEDQVYTAGFLGEGLLCKGAVASALRRSGGSRRKLTNSNFKGAGVTHRRAALDSCREQASPCRRLYSRATTPSSSTYLFTTGQESVSGLASNSSEARLSLPAAGLLNVWRGQTSHLKTCGAITLW